MSEFKDEWTAVILNETQWNIVLMSLDFMDNELCAPGSSLFQCKHAQTVKDHISKQLQEGRVKPKANKYNDEVDMGEGEAQDRLRRYAE